MEFIQFLQHLERVFFLDNVFFLHLKEARQQAATFLTMVNCLFKSLEAGFTCSHYDHYNASPVSVLAIKNLSTPLCQLIAAAFLSSCALVSSRLRSSDLTKPAWLLANLCIVLLWAAYLCLLSVSL